jgi:hypothetical protein
VEVQLRLRHRFDEATQRASGEQWRWHRPMLRFRAVGGATRAHPVPPPARTGAIAQHMRPR